MSDRRWNWYDYTMAWIIAFCLAVWIVAIPFIVEMVAAKL